MRRDSREIILGKIKDALKNNPIITKSVPRDFLKSVFADSRETDLKLLFAEQFTAVGGEFIYIENTDHLLPSIQNLLGSEGQSFKLFCPHEELKENAFAELANHWVDHPKDAEISITTCRYLVARTGSIIVDDKRLQTTSIASPVHIVIANDEQMIFDFSDILNPHLAEKISTISILTGPSRTADIEKTLVIGVHGTKRLVLILIASPSKNIE